MDEWMTVIVAVASLVTALAALATILEMRRQRRSMYRPDFALLQFQIDAYRGDKGRPYVSNSSDPPPLDGLAGLYVPAVNVGLGSCKHLVLEWKYDVLEFARIIEQCDTDDEFGITYEDKRLDIKGKSNEFLSSTHFLARQDEEVIPYVVPVSVQPTPIQLRLPFAYTTLYEVWLYLALEAFRKKTSGRVLSDEPPPIRLVLSYQDIGDEQRNQEYEIVLQTCAFMDQKPEEGKLVPCMHGYVQPRRVK